MIALDLSAERWTELNRVLDDTFDRPESEWDHFVAERCGADEELLRVVRSVLAASREAENDPPGPSPELLEVVFTMGSPPGCGASRVGETIGRYRLTRELGRGGMATVYEAERADGAYERRVALKLLHPGSVGRDMAERFLRERQILSSLEHPNIASLLDGGEADDGTPYLVMELVDGVPITDWVERHQLSATDRIELFEQVVEAVDFAHRRLVVHRDLKPSNVLVTEQGRVKLLDFGIAKLLDPDVGDLQTRPATRWMTPAYASPEQIQGQPLTTASDVHALGVLLFELLSGQHPFTADRRSGFELERAICEEDAPRPSAMATDPRMASGLLGDLDAIVLKALRKEPEQRYGSANGLQDDLRRHLDGFPVDAHEGVWGYRAKKFVTRHWMGVSGAAALLIVVVAASTLVWRQRQVATAQRDLATQEAENSRLVIEFLSDVFGGRDPSAAPSDTVTARELLAWARERVDTEYMDRPALQLELVSVLAGAYSNLGLLDDSQELWREAVDLSRVQFGPSSRELAGALLKAGSAAQRDRDFTGAEDFSLQALDIAEARAAGRPDTLVAYALMALGNARVRLLKEDDAERDIRRALEILGDVGSDSSVAYNQALLVLAPVRRAQGDLAEAAELYEQAIPRLRELGLEDYEAVVHLNNLAFLRRTSGDYLEAVELYQEALSLVIPLYGAGHPNALTIRTNLASALSLSGDQGGAAELLREGLEAARAHYPEGHWRVGQAGVEFGSALLRTGRAEEAGPVLLEAARMYTTILGPEHEWTQFARAAFSVTQVLTGQGDIGQPYLDRFNDWIEETWETVTEGNRLGRAPLMVGLANIYRASGFDQEAERFDRLLATLDAEGR